MLISGALKRRDNEIERMHLSTRHPIKHPAVLKMYALIGRQFRNEIVLGLRPHRGSADIYCTYSLGNGFITEVRRGESRDTPPTESWS